MVTRRASPWKPEGEGNIPFPSRTTCPLRTNARKKRSLPQTKKNLPLMGAKQAEGQSPLSPASPIIPLVYLLRMKPRILSISYDEMLLKTRGLLLEREGFSVISAWGFIEALELCGKEHTFDLVVMGHSMPHKDKTSLVKTIRKHCKAPVISLQKHHEPPLAEAEFTVDSAEGPLVFLNAVKAALK